MKSDILLPIEGEEVIVKDAPGKRYTRSLEYELIANLSLKQYVTDEGVRFDELLAISLADRIPAFVTNYGLKRTHRLIKMILQEFTYSIPLPKSAKLSDTKIAACACDLLLSAFENHLSLEDLIVFFEQAKKGVYGKFRGTLTHFSVMQKLEQYLAERASAHAELKQKQEAALLKMTALPRIGDTRSIGEIMQQANVINMTTKISG